VEKRYLGLWRLSGSLLPVTAPHPVRSGLAYSPSTTPPPRTPLSGTRSSTTNTYLMLQHLLNTNNQFATHHRSLATFQLLVSQCSRRRGWAGRCDFVLPDTTHVTVPQSQVHHPFRQRAGSGLPASGTDLATHPRCRPSLPVAPSASLKTQSSRARPPADGSTARSCPSSRGRSGRAAHRRPNCRREHHLALGRAGIVNIHQQHHGDFIVHNPGVTLRLGRRRHCGGSLPRPTVSRTHGFRATPSRFTSTSSPPPSNVIFNGWMLATTLVTPVAVRLWLAVPTLNPTSRRRTP